MLAHRTRPQCRAVSVPVANIPGPSRRLTQRRSHRRRSPAPFYVRGRGREAVTACSKRSWPAGLTRPPQIFLQQTALTMPHNHQICTRPRANRIAVCAAPCTAHPAASKHYICAEHEWRQPPSAIPLPMAACSGCCIYLSDPYHLLVGPIVTIPPGPFPDHCAVGDAMSLDLISSNDHAGHPPLANDVQPILDPSAETPHERREVGSFEARVPQERCLISR